MPNYDPELQTHFRLWLDGEEVPFPEGSARFVQGTIEPIDEAVSSRRTVNGTLRIQADPAFRKFRLTVSCTDAMLPALFGIDPRQVATVWSPVNVRERGTTPSRTPVPGSLASQDGWIEYRPVLAGYLTAIPSLSEPEWQSDANWSLVFEESAVPEVYFVTLAGADLATVAPGGALTFNVGVLAATNTGLPITFARVGGSLPPGTSLNASTGVISGTPTTAGLYTFTIRGTSGGQTGEQTYSILVNAASSPRVNFAAVAQQNYVAGAYTGLNLAPSVTVENSSGVPVFDIQSGSLPPGLTLSTGGVVFGTPTGYGPYAAQIRAIIPTGEFDVQTVAFQIEDSPPLATGGTVIDFNDPDTGLAMRALRFTASGNLVVTRQGWADVEYHGSGAGGGFGAYGAGGGAGARIRRRVFLVPGTYPQVVPAGGAGGPSATVDGGDGSPATGLGFSAPGGGGGASRRSSGASAGRSGASGGGAALGAASGGAATAPASMSDGNVGGSSTGASQSGAGGGGAGGPGTAPNKNDAGTLLGGDGGPGVVTNFDGTNRTVGAGGGGGSRTNVGPGLGGSGVGGNGGTFNNVTSTNTANPTAGAANTGSGGGGAGGIVAGAAGGSGYITIRFRRL